MSSLNDYYSVFHRFRHPKFTYRGLILGSSQFFLLPQRPLKMTLAVKVVKIESKIIIFLPSSQMVKKPLGHIQIFH
jgi:hypothetical protein